MAGCSIISDSEVLCTSNTPWFYSYDIINGEITRHPFLKGATRNHKMTRFYSNPNSDFIAFPTALGGISIISSKIRMIHHKNIFETISNSSSANFQILFEPFLNFWLTLSRLADSHQFDSAPEKLFWGLKLLFREE